MSRRRLLRSLAWLLPGFLALAAFAQGEAPVTRRIVLTSTHTGEEVDSTYFRDGAYVPAELGRLDWLLRDHRTAGVLSMEKGLFDLLHELAAAAGREPHYEIISGYRSPATNAKLAATAGGVSSKSLHMEGRAIDVRLRGCPTDQLRDLALARKAGGVGYYPDSDFVHLDLGRVRSWSG